VLSVCYVGYEPVVALKSCAGGRDKLDVLKSFGARPRVCSDWKVARV
jgi:hypothetical protein